MPFAEPPEECVAVRDPCPFQTDVDARRPSSRRATPRLDDRPLTRRALLTRLGVGLAGFTWGSFLWTDPARAKGPAPGAPPVALLEKSPFVYISPLLANGDESTCHAEVWFGWLDDAVVVTVAADRWKARALSRGLDRARIWVGNHGRWKTMLGGRNEDFRSAPNFVAEAEKIEEPATIDRLLAIYDEKYPHEIASWRDRMKSGNADGSRIMIRYRPVPEAKK
jgi:hypothetical protein